MEYIDSRFERLEKALSNLIDSVTKYHPSTIQAEELKAADNELTKGLEEGAPPLAGCIHKLTLSNRCSTNSSKQLSSYSEASPILSRVGRSNP
jgi:hypothetical protein